MGIFIFVLITVIAVFIAAVGFKYKHKILQIAGVAAAVLTLFLGCALIGNRAREKEEHLTNLVQELKEEICPVQFKIIKIKNGEITVDVKYLDLEGKEAAAKKTYTLIGEEIHFDFTVVKLDDSDNYLFFPKSLYTNGIAPKNGINLTEDYSVKGYPVIYNKYEKFVKQNDSRNIKIYQEMISKLFGFVRGENTDLIQEQFGNAVHNMKGITDFKKGNSYKIICHPHKGSVEIQKM